MPFIQVNQSPSRVKKMVGYDCHTRKLFRLPFVCVRKPLRSNPSPVEPYFCFISNPGMINSKLRNTKLKPFMWLHCFRDDSVLPGKAPRYLMPESNFVDEIHCPTTNREKSRFDYVCWTLSGAYGHAYKGLGYLLRDVIFFNRMGLKGLAFFYNGTRGLSKQQRRRLATNNVSIKSGRVKRHQVAAGMAKSKFGYFPNINDCSPRTIPEFFLQNRPVIVNKDILGGWHYFADNPGLGALFEPGNEESVVAAVQHVTSLENNQREIWMNNFGFNKHSKILCDLLKKHYPCKELEHCTHAYFRDYQHVFKKAPEIFSE